MQLSQPSRASRASKAEERRRHLIDVTRALFVQRGFHATGVAQIAAASGIRVGQIYRDFGSKEDLIAALVAEDLAQFLDEASLRRAVDDDDRAAVRGWLDRFFAVDKPIEQCCLMAEIHAEAARNARIAEIHGAIDQRVRGEIMAALTALMPDAALADRRRDVGDLIMTLGAGLMSRRVVDRGLDAARLSAAIVRIVDTELAMTDRGERQASLAAVPSSTSGSSSAATPASSAASSRAKSAASSAVIPKRAATSGA